jgi:D-aminoacyl-tRNA deacylase
MRAVLQRVSSASVTVDGRITGQIDAGLLVLVGLHKDDKWKDGEWIARKILDCRIFPDSDGRMNRSVTDTGGGVLIVSQFTLLGNVEKGTRPSFIDSMPAEKAKTFYEKWVKELRAATALKVEEGVFAADMKVALVNDGPVTILLDSHCLSRTRSG